MIVLDRFLIYKYYIYSSVRKINNDVTFNGYKWDDTKMFQSLLYIYVFINHNRYFGLRFGLANVIYNYKRLRLRVVCVGNF